MYIFHKTKTASIVRYITKQKRAPLKYMFSICFWNLPWQHFAQNWEKMWKIFYGMRKIYIYNIFPSKWYIHYVCHFCRSSAVAVANFHAELFKHLLETQDWTNYFLETDTNMLWDSLRNNIKNCLEIMCPLKTFKVCTRVPDWMTTDIRDNISLKKKLLKHARQTKLDEEWTAFRAQRQKLSNLIRKTKSEIVKEKLHRHNDNPRKFWEVINDSFGNLKDKKSQEIVLIDTNTDCKVSTEDGATLLMTSFVQLGKMILVISKLWIGTVVVIYMTVTTILVLSLNLLKWIPNMWKR